MNASNLSDSILAKIFGYVLSNRGVLYSPVYSFKRWKIERSLLSVCRAWRNIALPMVHEKSFILAVSTGVQSNDDDDIEIDRQSENIDDSNSDNYSETSCCPSCLYVYESSYGEGTYSKNSHEQMRLKVEDFAVTSSMDIISNHMDNPYPRHIDIIIDIRHNPVTGIRKVLEKARTHSKLLGKVETMELSFYSEYIANELFKLPTDIEEAQEMGTELAQIIPSIKSIKWHKSNGYEHALLGFVECMVKSYAHQLTEFVLPQTALDNVENLSDKLESICMYNNVNISRNVPHIPAKSIKNLNIGYKAWNFDWSAFIGNSSSSSPKMLVFENLKSLQLRIETNIFKFYNKCNILAYDKHAYDYKMMALNLDNITVRTCPPTLLFLASIEGPSVIKNINFEMQTSVFSFRNFNLASARKVLAEYGDKDESSAYHSSSGPLMSDLLNIHGLAEYSNAVIGHSYSPPDVMKISWKYLDEVKFEDPLEDSQLELLVARHPNLKVL